MSTKNATIVYNLMETPPPPPARGHPFGGTHDAVEVRENESKIEVIEMNAESLSLHNLYVLQINYMYGSH